MRMRRTLAYLVFASCVLLIVVKNRAAEVRNEVRSGSWAISKSEEAGKVEFALMEHRRDGSSNHQSSWPASVFQGVDFSQPGRQDVRFTIARDAGKIECEGYLNDGEGAGIFHETRLDQQLIVAARRVKKPQFRPSERVLLVALSAR